MFQNYFSANPKSIFLIDGLGAFLSTLLLVLLAHFESIFGMPKDALLRLVAITTAFTLYSLGSFLLSPRNWKRYLTVIAVANILYCCVTLVLLFYHWEKLSGLGITYFLAEVLVVLFLSSIELRLTYRSRK